MCLCLLRGKVWANECQRMGGRVCLRERDREREKERKRFKQATVFEKRRPLDETKKYAQENPKQLEKLFS